MPRRRRTVLIAAILTALTVSTSYAATVGEGPPAPKTVEQSGVVRSGDTGLGRAEVTLFQAGDHTGAAPRRLATTLADERGRFQLRYVQPEQDGAVLYLTADAGKRSTVRPARPHTGSPVRLAAVLSKSKGRSKVVVNERTTVATAYALAQFTENGAISGPNPGLHNAAAISHNLAQVTSGNAAPFLAAPPNGSQTSTLRTFNSLADILAGCVHGHTCPELFRLAARPGQPDPKDTFQAAVNIARAPGPRAAEIFTLQGEHPLYQPALSAAPDAWTLALRYVGNGQELDGPGNIAFDAKGYAWVVNNYEFSPDPLQSVCGGRELLRFTPTGQDAKGAPYHGGGLYGAGFGVSVDPKGRVWAANFGFQGRGCPLDASLLYRSVSQFSGSGRPLSPPTGWQVGGIVQPQGTASDREGTIWIANCGGRSVTRIPHGNPARAQEITPAGDSLVKPFGVTTDPLGRAWATGNGSDTVVMMEPDGTPARTITGGGIKRPMGIASDSMGNQWVANGGVVVAPCEGTTREELIEAITDVVEGETGASVTMIRPDGSKAETPFTNGGLFLPWGVAVDGDDNVWVANFGGNRVAQLCGARLSACPPGHQTGQPISPADTGYTSDGLERNTAVQVDPSGNVWLANNWRTVPVQTNPGGRELVVFVGLAAPVRTPLVGAPRRP
ncbi:hypothetical protein [Streptomyces sp. NPDC006879]|uniref:hypothetical protein n=1 Tax=Streptomyces sp. NPDC006879 TaxID=3364767 RepID=UPI00368A0316